MFELDKMIMHQNNNIKELECSGADWQELEQDYEYLEELEQEMNELIWF